MSAPVEVGYQPRELRLQTLQEPKEPAPVLGEGSRAKAFRVLLLQAFDSSGQVLQGEVSTSARKHMFAF